jgi:tetratricopeptide (TPR) repeat protein
MSRCPAIPPITTLALLLGGPASTRAATGAPEPVDASAVASADASDTERARGKFELGARLYDEARYQEALAAFREAAALFPSPDLEYNMAQCHEQLDQSEDAITHYRAYLRGKPDAPDRANVWNRIARLEALSSGTKTAAGPRAAPTAAAAKPVPVAAPAPRDDRRVPGRSLAVAGITLFSVGAAAALAGGLGFGLTAGSRSREVDDVTHGNPEGLTFEDSRALEDEGKRFEILQLVFIASGSALAVTGTILWAVGGTRQRRARSALMVGFDGSTAAASVAGSF